MSERPGQLGYKYITEKRHETSMHAPEHVTFLKTKESDEFFSNFKDFLRSEVTEELRSANEYSMFPKIFETIEDAEMMMRGTFNLVNTVIDRSTKGEDVKTLVFLDKSARNAGYLFNTIWRGLENDGEITKDIKKPSIKFLNVGRYEDTDKYKNEFSLNLLKEAFNKEDFEYGNVLIVDEIIAQGRVSRRAMSLLNNVFEISTHAISQFDEVPAWYDSTELSGVSEPWLVPKRLNDLDIATGRQLVDLVERLGPKNFTDFYISLYPIKVEINFTTYTLEGNSYSPESLGATQEDVELLHKVKELCPEVYWAEDILTFINSAGGFFVEPNKGNNEKFIRYRQVLRMVAEGFLIFRKHYEQERAEIEKEEHFKNEKVLV